MGVLLHGEATEARSSRRGSRAARDGRRGEILRPSVRARVERHDQGAGPEARGGRGIRCGGSRGRAARHRSRHLSRSKGGSGGRGGVTSRDALRTALASMVALIAPLEALARTELSNPAKPAKDLGFSYRLHEFSIRGFRDGAASSRCNAVRRQSIPNGPPPPWGWIQASSHGQIDQQGEEAADRLAGGREYAPSKAGRWGTFASPWEGIVRWQTVLALAARSLAGGTDHIRQSDPAGRQATSQRCCGNDVVLAVRSSTGRRIPRRTLRLGPPVHSSSMLWGPAVPHYPERHGLPMGSGRRALHSQGPSPASRHRVCDHIRKWQGQIASERTARRPRRN